jgi:hypothetical protein
MCRFSTKIGLIIVSKTEGVEHMSLQRRRLSFSSLEQIPTHISIPESSPPTHRSTHAAMAL